VDIDWQQNFSVRFHDLCVESGSKRRLDHIASCNGFEQLGRDVFENSEEQNMAGVVGKAERIRKMMRNNN
jgi:hypothetical protein